MRNGKNEKTKNMTNFSSTLESKYMNIRFNTHFVCGTAKNSRLEIEQFERNERKKEAK